VIRARRLETGLVVAIIATLMLTIVSITIYKVGGFYRYDLSRPGYEKERAELATFPGSISLDTTSPLTRKAASDFIGELDKHRQNLEAYNTFGNGGLSDEDLQLVPPPTP
ncbi:MAG TPA: hypothetical protein VM581_01960, partial [Magnetospirillaceae bacterium]|nr:hypothetical protein [Magnetospirillaceae bacterium]